MAAKKTGMTIALPEGKNLGPQTLDLMRDARIIVKRSHPRTIEARVEGIPRITRAIFCRPEQVCAFLAAGGAELGITGEDAVLEYPHEDLEILTRLPYSRQTNSGTRCVLFTYAENPANTLEDVRQLDGIRGRHGIPDSVTKRSVVASEYPKETEAFLRAQQVNLRVLSPLSGSAEMLVHERICDYGVALVETGTTLRVNRLKEIEGGKIFDSCAVLIGSKNGLGTNLDNVETEYRRSVALLLGNLLKGTLEARDKVYLLMNAPTKRVERIRKILPALKSPTVQPLADPEYCSISSVVSRSEVNGLILELMKYGATGFVTLPPSTVM